MAKLSRPADPDAVLSGMSLQDGGGVAQSFWVEDLADDLCEAVGKETVFCLVEDSER